MVPRYIRLWFALARYSLVRELSFRMNFLVKIFVEILWLTILLGFFEVIFANTNSINDWSRNQYLFFMGCYFALGGLIETLFLENCNSFADLVRTGDLDFYLLKPIDEQFLISCKFFDWSCVPNVFMGFGVMFYALAQMGWAIPLGGWGVLLFLILFTCGVLLMYGFLMMLTALSVWLMRNQSLFEMWWLFTTLMRYPREIFRGPWASPVGWFFSFVIPIMLVSNIPARVMVQLIEPGMVLYMVLATGGVLMLSRWIFKSAMQRYRSASS